MSDWLDEKFLLEDAKKYAESKYPQRPTFSKIAKEGFIKGFKVKKYEVINNILKTVLFVAFLATIVCLIFIYK